MVGTSFNDTGQNEMVLFIVSGRHIHISHPYTCLNINSIANFQNIDINTMFINSGCVVYQSD